MDFFKCWMIAGIILVLVEFIVPGGIVVFLGLAAISTSALIYFDVVHGAVEIWLSWILLSLVYMLVLRSLFIKYFEGDSTRHNVDEDEDLLGGVVLVTQEVFPHKEGRVRFRDTTWQARSDDSLAVNDRAMITGRDGQTLLVSPLLK